MKFKILLRPALTVVFGFIGALVARSGTPPVIFAATGDYFLIVAVLAFAILGFILPDILELAGRAGITALSHQIASYLQTARKKVRKGSKITKYANAMVVDTSALIDGRLVDIVKTGFIYGTFLIIPSVVGELHRLADNSSELKRVKGRRGLESLSNLQSDKNIKVEVLSFEPDDQTVDDKLVKLAGSIHAKIITVDFNLNRVAKVKKVTVLNLNELANAVKTAVLPSEQLRIQISAVGKEKDQGVGYLSDGTMVVVEDAAKLKGKTVDVEVLRVLQTVAGKMIFAQRVKNANERE